MGRLVRINDALYKEVQTRACAERRTIARQLEFLARMGKAALDNPDLPTEFVKELLISRAEGQKVAKPFLPAGASPLTATPYTESV